MNNFNNSQSNSFLNTITHKYLSKYCLKDYISSKQILKQHYLETDRKNINKQKGLISLYKNYNFKNNVKNVKSSDVISFTDKKKSLLNRSCQNISELKFPEKKHLNLRQIIIEDKSRLRDSVSTLVETPKGPHQTFSFLKNNYRIIQKLGNGQFGSVYMAVHVQTGFIGALKILQKKRILDKQKIFKQLLSQIKIQYFLNHPNLIKLYNFYADQDHIYLFQELGCDGQLFQILQKCQKFSQETTSMIARDIILGVNEMHSKSVIHRDIKLQNIVMIHGTAKICDFGWSVYEPKDFRKTICGTPMYFSPELLKQKKYSNKIDIWAIGVLAHQLYTGTTPFQIHKRQDLFKIIQSDFQMKKGSAELKSFLNFLLRKDPSKRPDAETLKKHPFIQNYQSVQTSQQLCYRK